MSFLGQLLKTLIIFFWMSSKNPIFLVWPISFKKYCFIKLTMENMKAHNSDSKTPDTETLKNIGLRFKKKESARD